MSPHYWTEDDIRAACARMGTALPGPAGSMKHETAPVDEPESSFQARMLRLARTHGWLCYHTRDSRGSAEGFPDVVLCRDMIIFAELKTRTGKLTAEQERWLTMLSTTHSRVEVYCWRPADWPLIVHRLTQPWRKDA